MPKAFKLESEISERFSPEICIRKEFGYFDWYVWEADEVEGLFGIPDHLAVFWKQDALNRRIARTFSFEMKRKDWKRALAQAFRYASFSDYSFVVLDDSFVHRAKANIEDFRKANIGLLSVTFDGATVWHHRPKRRLPYSEQMKLRLHTTLEACVFNRGSDHASVPLRWQQPTNPRSCNYYLPA